MEKGRALRLSVCDKTQNRNNSGRNSGRTKYKSQVSCCTCFRSIVGELFRQTFSMRFSVTMKKKQIVWNPMRFFSAHAELFLRF